MNLEKLKGIGVALITPFKADKTVDFDGLKRVLNHTKAVDYWVVMGTTGEAATITQKEKESILAYIKENNPLKKPIIYGIGGNHTAELLQNLEETNLEGVDAVLSVSPYYNKPSQRGIYTHYMTLADKSPLPIILYNVPGRTASNLTAATTLALAQHPNIIATKEASGNLEQCMEIASHKPDNFLLLSGDDLLAIPMISIGASGVISVLANALPDMFTQMIKLALAQDFAGASQILYRLLSINPFMYEESNPVGVKELMRQMKVCEAYVRLPLVEASTDLEKKISHWLEANQR